MSVSADRLWTEDQWREFVFDLVTLGYVKWLDVATIVLGELNPPQVGTSMTGKKWQKTYGKGTTWQAVKKWLYGQPLGCRGCGVLIKLEADHIVPKEEIGDKADRLENMQLLCKRCNAKKRPSHTKAGKTFLTAEAGLMWLRLHHRPPGYEEFKKLCRDYGLTMADIRFQEAWALAEWLRAAGRYP